MNAAAPCWLARTHDHGCGCYVHLPFCDRICPYCDFAVVRFREALVARYLRALHAEIERVCSGGPSGPPQPIQTLYFGGGTPSALTPEKLASIAGAIFSGFATPKGSIEFTMEANPSRGVSDLEAYREIGVNRLSVGVQSFDDGELHRLGRDHDQAQAVAYIRAARSAGFDNVSLDLIAGTPGQDARSFRESLRQALDLAPDHISVYGLTIEPGTPYAAWREREPHAFADDDALAELLELAESVLCDAGMSHYEISNFARPGFECAHNVGYWRQRDCFAIGLSAAGYRDGMRYSNARDLNAYCDALNNGYSARVAEERLSPAARIGEAAMLALRTAGGLGILDFQERFGVDARSIFAAAIEASKTAGLLEEGEGTVRLTRRGRLLANTACALFLEPEVFIAS